MKLLPDSVGLTRIQLSVTDLTAMNGALSHFQPELVFNCAAYNAVDGAEGEEEAAYQVNAQGAFNVGLACAQYEVRLIHFSTNFVFDGALDRPYLEKDEVGPLGVYGKSKLEGEKLMSMVMPRALIIRTAALFGGDGSLQRHNFPERILERARAGERLRGVRFYVIDVGPGLRSFLRVQANASTEKSGREPSAGLVGHCTISATKRLRRSGNTKGYLLDLIPPC